MVIGGRDMESDAVSVRLRHGGPQGAKPKGGSHRGYSGSDSGESMIEPRPAARLDLLAILDQAGQWFRE